MNSILRAALPLLVISGVAFGQCGAGGKLIFLPVADDNAGGFVCTGLAGSGTGNVTTAVTLTADLPVIGAGTTAIGVGTKTGTGTKFVTDTSPTITLPTFVTPALGTPASGVLTNATGLPTAGLVDGAVTAVKMVNAGVFTGDVTTTFPAITVAKVNGIAYSATAAAHSVPVITTANTTASQKVIPDCRTAGSSALIFTQSTDSFGCNTISGGGSPTIYVDGVSIGSQAIVNFITGTGGSVSGNDTGTEIDVTIGPSQSTMLTAGTAQNVTGAKSFSANTLILTPGADSGTTDGSVNINASKQLDWYDATNSVRRIAYAFTGTPATASQLIGGSATAGLTSVFSTTGSGTTVVLASAPTISNPVIGSGGFVNANHTHADAGNGGLLDLTGVPLFAATAKTSNYQVLAADFLLCKTIPVASGTFTITLVASGVSQPASGQCIDIINYGSGVVTVARSGQNINGTTTSQTLAAGSASAPTGLHVVSDGTNYVAQPLGASSGGGGYTTDAVVIGTGSGAAAGGLYLTGGSHVQLSDTSGATGANINFQGSYFNTNRSFRTPQFYGNGSGPSGVTGCSATVGSNSKDPAGTIVAGASATCDIVITFDIATDHNFSCYMSNQTHPGATNRFDQTASNTTTVTFHGTAVSSDVLSYLCLAY